MLNFSKLGPIGGIMEPVSSSSSEPINLEIIKESVNESEKNLKPLQYFMLSEELKSYLKNNPKKYYIDDKGKIVIQLKDIEQEEMLKEIKAESKKFGSNLKVIEEAKERPYGLK